MWATLLHLSVALVCIVLLLGGLGLLIVVLKPE